MFATKVTHHDVRQSASLTAWSAHYGQKLEQYMLKVFASDKYIYPSLMFTRKTGSLFKVEHHCVEGSLVETDCYG